MDLEALAKAFPEMTVSISLSDLLKAQEILIQRTRDEERRAMARAGAELDDLIPKDTVRQKLGVAPATLWRWEKEGYLPAVRIGTKIYYRVSAVDRILEDRAVAR